MDAILVLSSASVLYGAAIDGGGLVEAGDRKREALRAVLAIVYREV